MEKHNSQGDETRMQGLLEAALTTKRVEAANLDSNTSLVTD